MHHVEVFIRDRRRRVGHILPMAIALLFTGVFIFYKKKKTNEIDFLD
jgi:hypothetical protein